MELWLILTIIYVVGFPIVHATWEHFNAAFMDIDPAILVFSYALWPITFTLWVLYRVTQWFWEHANG